MKIQAFYLVSFVIESFNLLSFEFFYPRIPWGTECFRKCNKITRVFQPHILCQLYIYNSLRVRHSSYNIAGEKLFHTFIVFSGGNKTVAKSEALLKNSFSFCCRLCKRHTEDLDVEYQCKMCVTWKVIQTKKLHFWLQFLHKFKEIHSYSTIRNFYKLIN